LREPKLTLVETPAETAGSFPTDLAAETGRITSGLDRAKLAQEREENGLEELPVLGATGEKGAQPQVVAFFFIDVDRSQVALAAGGDIESQTEGTTFYGTGRVGAVVVRRRYEERAKTGDEEVSDFGLTIDEAIGVDLTKFFQDLVMFQVEADDVVIAATALDDGPIHNVVGGGTEGIAHVGLLEDFLLAGAGAAVGDELRASEGGALDAVDNVEEA